MKKLCLPTITFTAMLCFGSYAQAGDAKLYSAAGCSYDRSHFKTYRDGTIENISSAGQTVQCPIVRDNTLSSNDIMGSNKSWISVRDNSSTHAVVCFLSASYPFGNSYYTRSTSISTSGYGASWQKKYFSGISNVNSSANYTIDCLVPGVQNGKTSAIGTYRIEES